MSKIKHITCKEIKTTGKRILAISHDIGIILLKNKIPFGFNRGVNGWNCNFYQITPEVIICSGSKTIGIKIEDSFVKKYIRLSSNISKDKILSIEDKQEQIDDLIICFTKEAYLNYMNKSLNKKSKKKMQKPYYKTKESEDYYYIQE